MATAHKMNNHFTLKIKLNSPTRPSLGLGIDDQHSAMLIRARDRERA